MSPFQRTPSGKLQQEWLIADLLWGNKAKLRYLMIASILLLFSFLGGREIWTQEHRWADIVSGMFYRHDFLHPYLGVNNYYDKPLLSYWLIALVIKLTGSFTTWALRFPSACAGLLAVWSIYRLGTQLNNKHLGLLAGWLLLTTFYFVFWARISSADMLNVAGTLFAVAWYVDKREQAGLFDYAIFFLILALTSLCKGLVGAIIPLIAVATDVVLRRAWHQHLRWLLLLSLLPAMVVYLFPFLASSYVGGDAYGENGLYLVYRENILRYFQPFDHRGAIYTYFIYLPIYTLPWTVFFIPALLTLKSRWRKLSCNSKWISWTLFLLFIFFTLSGSRRSYYVLPVVPYAILFTADWILSTSVLTLKREWWAAVLTVFSSIFIFIMLDVLPTWYYATYGVNQFVVLLLNEANKIKPWDKWNIIMLDAETKLNFYLHLPPETKHYGIRGNRNEQTATKLIETWPIIKEKSPGTIFITRQLYAPLLQGYFIDYRLIETPAQAAGLPFLKGYDLNAPVAFIPRK